MSTLTHKRGGKINKSTILRDRLRQMARSMGPNAKLPTRDELCAELGTSRATMDNILNVLEAENTLFRRHGSGIYVSPKVHCTNIRVLINAALVDQDDVSPFWGILLGKLVREAGKRSATKNEDIQFRLVAPDPDPMTPLPADVLQGIESGCLHGVLCIGMEGKSADWSIPDTIPMVSYAGWGCWHVVLQNEAIIGEAAARLARRGCRAIGLWTRNSSRRNRIDGSAFERVWTDVFRRALESQGLCYHPELRRFGVPSAAEVCEGDIEAIARQTPTGYQDQGYEAAMRTFGASGANLRPDGIVIDDDMLTSGALAAMRKLGLEPERDVLIASHSNIGSPVLYGWRDRLMLWRVDAAAIVAAMFALLDRLMAGEHPEHNIMNVYPSFTD
jgi:hypothetical protein